MGFLIGAVVVILLVFLLAFITIKKPVFGRVIIGLSLVMIITAVFFYFQKDNRVEKKKHLIPLEQVELSPVAHNWSYGNFYKLSADIKNNSDRYRLQSIVLQISLYKCPDTQALKTDNQGSSIQFDNCQQVMQREHKIDTRLAAQQSRKIESHFLLDVDTITKNVVELNNGIDSLQWKIDLLGVNARK
jgi:hypothetical protein